jgi:hypothetical protein
MAVLAVYGDALGAAAILGAIAELFILRTFYECATATATVLQALKQVEGEEQERAVENNDDEVTHSGRSNSETAADFFRT